MWKGESLLDIRNRPNLLHALHPALLLNFSAVCFGYDLSSGTAHSDLFWLILKNTIFTAPYVISNLFSYCPDALQKWYHLLKSKWQKILICNYFFAISSVAMIEQARKGFRLLSPRWGLYKVSIFCVHYSKLTQIMVRECSCLIFDQNSRKSF